MHQVLLIHAMDEVEIEKMGSRRRNEFREIRKERAVIYPTRNDDSP